MNVITHRGLEPSQKNFPPESSLEAFKSHLERGFGIEFDPYFTSGDILVTHNLSKPSPSLIQVLNLIRKQGNTSPNALHFKGKFQTSKKTDKLLKILSLYPDVVSGLIIFDVKPEIAPIIRSKLPAVGLAPSVADEYDISRYNSAVSGTLLSVSEAIRYKSYYDWAWLDEWDLQKPGGLSKKFYTQKTFSTLRRAGYKIAAVTPELHGTSPGLLGGEFHPDSQTLPGLMKRISEIISLHPDSVCTDYPEEVKKLIL